MTLELAYRRARASALFQDRFKEIADQVRTEVKNVHVPNALAHQVRALLKRQPTRSWDSAISDLAANDVLQESRRH